MTDDFDDIHFIIKKLRVNKNFTQAYMAKKLGFQSTSAYCKIESGETDITLKKLKKIASLLKVSVSDLMFYKGYKESISENCLDNEFLKNYTEVLAKLDDIENCLNDLKNKFGIELK
jgi:transcriptional regulator with XRE-family HTH domain